jgi:hypothetical protein
MSKVSIEGNASGTGTFTIAAPNSNSNYTLTLPAAAGTIATTETAGFESGTVMMFAQTAAPTGWTKNTTTGNNHALRLVTGSVSTGGTVDFSTAFASKSVAGTVGGTTLTTTQMPSHTHTLPTVVGAGCTNISATQTLTVTPSTQNSGSTGGGGSHDHSFAGTAIDLAVKYVDIIRATKD